MRNELVPFHLECDTQFSMVDFGCEYQGMQNLKSVADAPAAAVLSPFQPGALSLTCRPSPGPRSRNNLQPHIMRLDASPAWICSNHNGPFLPDWYRRLGLASESWASHDAVNLRTECQSLIRSQTPPRWNPAVLPKLLSQGWGLLSFLNHPPVGPWCPLTAASSLLYWMPDYCPADTFPVHSSLLDCPLWPVFARMGSTILVFKRCPSPTAGSSRKLLSRYPQPGQFSIASLRRQMGLFPVSRPFLPAAPTPWE